MSRKIVIKLLKTIVIWTMVGVGYLLIVQRLGWGIPCVFRTLFGIRCPGCGMTRALGEVIKGNFKGAWDYNALSLTVLPLTCIYLLYRFVREEMAGEAQTPDRRGREFYIWEYIFLISMMIIAVGYAIIRNTNYI